MNESHKKIIVMKSTQPFPKVSNNTSYNYLVEQMIERWQKKFLGLIGYSLRYIKREEHVLGGDIRHASTISKLLYLSIKDFSVQCNFCIL